MDNISKINEVDREGMRTLNIISEADHLNQWFYDSIQSFCTGKILEIGSGIGNISSFFIRDNRQISLSELRLNYVAILQEKFAGIPNVNKIFQMDIVDPDFDNKFFSDFESFDSIYALNIIEHIENDIQGIANCKKLLKPGGQLVVLVPAYQCLYNSFDKELMHHRRYTTGSLNEIMIANGLKVIHQQYFNLFGILGWWVNGNLLRRNIIPSGQMKIYNSLVPFFRLIDKLTLNKIGLSVINVGKKV